MKPQKKLTYFTNALEMSKLLRNLLQKGFFPGSCAHELNIANFFLTNLERTSTVEIGKLSTPIEKAENE